MSTPNTTILFKKEINHTPVEIIRTSEGNVEGFINGRKVTVKGIATSLLEKFIDNAKDTLSHCRVKLNEYEIDITPVLSGGAVWPTGTSKSSESIELKDTSAVASASSPEQKVQIAKDTLIQNLNNLKDTKGLAPADSFANLAAHLEKAIHGAPENYVLDATTIAQANDPHTYAYLFNEINKNQTNLTHFIQEQLGTLQVGTLTAQNQATVLDFLNKNLDYLQLQIDKLKGSAEANVGFRSDVKSEVENQVKLLQTIHDSKRSNLKKIQDAFQSLIGGSSEVKPTNPKTASAVASASSLEKKAQAAKDTLIQNLNTLMDTKGLLPSTSFAGFAAHHQKLVHDGTPDGYILDVATIKNSNDPHTYGYLFNEIDKNQINLTHFVQEQLNTLQAGNFTAQNQASVLDYLNKNMDYLKLQIDKLKGSVEASRGSRADAESQIENQAKLLDSIYKSKLSNVETIKEAYTILTSQTAKV